MCLNADILGKDANARGVGFKVVRPHPRVDGAYTQIYRYFDKDGLGGTDYYQDTADVYRPRTRFQVGRWTRSNSKWEAISLVGDPYPAGLHIWKKFSRAYKFFQTLESQANVAIVMVEWRGRLAGDLEALVVDRARIIRVVREARDVSE